MNLSLSPLALERRLRKKHTNRDWRSTWRPSSVSVVLGYIEVGLLAHSVPMDIAKAIDRYIHLRAESQPNGTPEIDPRLSAIIETIFNRCIADGEYQQVRASSITSLSFQKPYPLGSQRQLASLSNLGGWTSSNEFTNKQKTFLYCLMPWKP